VVMFYIHIHKVPRFNFSWDWLSWVIFFVVFLSASIWPRLLPFISFPVHQWSYHLILCS
jgi:hypothetical protein